MHIPNGFLSDPVCTATTLATVGALGVGIAGLRRANDARSSAWVAAIGAGVFAAQMINFPIGDGTSGHVVGAALAAILLGPWRGMLTMAVVLAVQCLAFGDGGLSTLGANILNMAVVATLTATVIYRLGTQSFAGQRGQLIGAAAAAFGSVLASAALCSLELAVSGTYPLAEVLPAMLSVHAVIAIGEVLLTVVIVSAVVGRREQHTLSRGALALTLAGALVLAGLLSPWASSAPDGLERVAESLNFARLAGDATFAIAPDYEVPGIAWPALAVALAGMAGVAIVFALSYTVDRTAKVRVRKQ